MFSDIKLVIDSMGRPFYMWLFFLIAILIIKSVIWLVKSNKNPIKRSELASNNAYVLENKERIEQNIDANTVNLKKLKIRAIASIILIFIFVVASIILFKSTLIAVVTFVVSFIAFAKNIFTYYAENDKVYDDLVKNVLHDYDPDLVYNPNSGLAKSEYKTCLFAEQCDIYTSEDSISNPGNGFYYSDVTIKSETEDDDGNTHTQLEFKGSLAKINIKNTNCRIFLGSNKKKLVYINDGLNNVNLENEEFNKLFKACTDNELQAYKILTPDVMEEIVNIKKTTYGDIDIRILYDWIYVRFASGGTFDSSLFNKGREKKELLQSIAILEEVMKTMEKIKNIIESKNIE